MNWANSFCMPGAKSEVVVTIPFETSWSRSKSPASAYVVSALTLCAREIPHDTVALKEAALIGDGTIHRKATVGANQEGHGRLAGRLIVGGGRSNLKAVHAGVSRLSDACGMASVTIGRHLCP